MAIPMVGIPKPTISFTPQTGNRCRWIHTISPISAYNKTMSCFENSRNENNKKLVWIWTENKQVMTSAVERGWNTFIFTCQDKHLANEWSSMALICPLFLENGGLFDNENRRIGSFSEISSHEELNQLTPEDEEAKNVVLDLLGWQGPVHAYVAVPGGKTSYLSELQAGKEVLVVNQSGQQRIAIVGRVKIEKRPLILVEAKDMNL